MMGKTISGIKELHQNILAIFRFSEKAVCSASSNMGNYDFHDYPDSVEGKPYHFHLLTCKRCDKKFYM